MLILWNWFPPTDSKSATRKTSVCWLWCAAGAIKKNMEIIIFFRILDWIWRRRRENLPKKQQHYSISRGKISPNWIIFSWAPQAIFFLLFELTLNILTISEAFLNIKIQKIEVKLKISPCGAIWYLSSSREYLPVFFCRVFLNPQYLPGFFGKTRQICRGLSSMVSILNGDATCL